MGRGGEAVLGFVEGRFEVGKKVLFPKFLYEMGFVEKTGLSACDEEGDLFAAAFLVKLFEGAEASGIDKGSFIETEEEKFWDFVHMI